MKQPWLEGEFSEIIEKLKDQLQNLNTDLMNADLEQETLTQLSDIIENLDELFLLVIVGEVKSGKSSVINALFGEKICPEGVIPVTDKINVLKYGERPIERYINDYLVERYINFDKLKNMHFVDTPGTNSIIQQHQEITQRFIPKSDLVMFCTSIDRPYTQTERDFLSLISKEWRKRVFFLLTKIDIKDEEDEIQEVINYIKTNVMKDFNITPLIFPCSPKKAFKAKNNNDADLLKESRFDKVEDYIFETLSDREKLELKLVSPIESSMMICQKSLAEFAVRLEIIKDHSATIEKVKNLVKSQANAIQEGYSRHILEISNLLMAVSNRAINFLDEKISLANFRNLMDKDKFKLEFNQIVLQEFEKKLWEIMQKATDEVVRREMTVWSEALNYYNEWIALQKYKHDAIGKVSSEFTYNRDKIVEDVKLKFDMKLNEFNYEQQCSKIFDLANKGVMQTFGTIFVAGGGAVIGAIALSGAAPVVGTILGAFVLSGLGLFILPQKRKKAIRDFKQNFDKLREDIIKVLETHISDEISEMIKIIESQFQQADDHFTKLESRTLKLTDTITQKRDALEILRVDIIKQIEKTYNNNIDQAKNNENNSVPEKNQDESNIEIVSESANPDSEKSDDEDKKVSETESEKSQPDVSIENKDEPLNEDDLTTS